MMEGLQQLAELVAEGGSRISVMPGGGVTADNAATVARVTGGCPVIAQAVMAAALLVERDMPGALQPFYFLELPRPSGCRLQRAARHIQAHRAQRDDLAPPQRHFWCR